MKQITHYMSSIKKRLNSFLADSCKQYDISAAEATFIYEISQHPNCRQSDLCKVFSCDKAHAHRIFSKLTDKHIIKSSVNCNQCFILTPNGQKIAQKISHTIQAATIQLKSGLSEQDILTLTTILEKCAENAKNLKTEANCD